jgi:hypothetical protein
MRFGAVPPFGRRLEKQHEFPDAPSILALDDWAHVNHATMRVVSGDQGVIAAAAEHVPEMLQAQIEDRIADDFLDGNFFVEDQDGEVSDITVDEVDLLGWYLAVVDPEVVTFQFEAAVRFHATVTFPDPDQSAYDSESGETYVVGHIWQLG